MRDVMLDIEAFGAMDFPSICQIAAQAFDRYSGELGPSIEFNIDVRDSFSKGAVLDADTVYWWLSQSKEAQDAIIKEPHYSLEFVLTDLFVFLQEYETIWSHSVYDFSCIERSAKKIGLKRIPYKKSRDIRTLVDLAGIKPKKFLRDGLHHNALDDCKHQIKYCVEAFNKLRID